MVSRVTRLHTFEKVDPCYLFTTRKLLSTSSTPSCSGHGLGLKNLAAIKTTAPVWMSRKAWTSGSIIPRPSDSVAYSSRPDKHLRSASQHTFGCGRRCLGRLYVLSASLASGLAVLVPLTRNLIRHGIWAGHGFPARRRSHGRNLTVGVSVFLCGYPRLSRDSVRR